jgi:histone H3/H4
MYILKRSKAGSGFNVLPNNKNFKRLMRNKLSGHGIAEEVLEKVSKTAQKYSPSISEKYSNKSGDSIIRRNPKARKYISLNL